MAGARAAGGMGKENLMRVCRAVPNLALPASGVAADTSGNWGPERWADFVPAGAAWGRGRPWLCGV